jgi:hypothetical protein
MMKIYLQEVISKKTSGKKYYFVGILKVTDQKEQDPDPEIHGTDPRIPGSVLKCPGTLEICILGEENCSMFFDR